MRKTSQFTGDTDSNGRGLARNNGSKVDVLERAPGMDEDDDVWRVRFDRDGQVHRVAGDDLSPHPEAPETNVEFVTRMMEFSRQGALMQAFVCTAIEKYAELVKIMPQNQRDSMNNGILPYEPWARCADEALLLSSQRNGESSL